MNQIFISGNLTKAPEITMTHSGKRQAILSLFLPKKYRNLNRVRLSRKWLISNFGDIRRKYYTASFSR